MPSFDVTSEVDLQEVRNAVDQASREVATRFDFKDTGASVELKAHEIHLGAPTEDRLRALVQVLEEKLVRRQVSLKAVNYGKVEEGSRGAVRQVAELNAGISSEKAKQINKIVKDLNLKGVSSQTQGDQVRVSGKKRDDLQAVIASLKQADIAIPLQFGNFRD
ncbi:MAG: YajQ family cyclic di-GMP-binding protein [Actinomycetota bacterium]|nr:YajQ family cyclic di-GMP-binding protein [Actinomycetota bacterium]MDA8038507.1 YajQ family cyclic di-GMP-binding protein [Actinomycetota bacterium]